VLPYALTDEAKDDLDRHYTYLAERNPKAAQRLLESILAAIEQACLFPEAAPQVAGADEPGNAPGTRKLIETEYRYVMILIYRRHSRHLDGNRISPHGYRQRCR
jgi:plasmid stabilization system protein ParE